LSMHQDDPAQAIHSDEGVEGLELVLCNNAIRAACHLLNLGISDEKANLERAWEGVKRHVMRDLLAVWSAAHHQNAVMADDVKALDELNGDMSEKHLKMLDHTNVHFGGQEAPPLFRIGESEHIYRISEDYWSTLTHFNDNRFPFETCHLSTVSSVYDEIIDYQPHVLDKPHRWKMSQGLPVLKPCEENEADFKTGHIGLLRFHSRDEAASERDKKGAFYTPYVVAYDLTKRTLEPMVQEASISEILELKICDPAMGSGVFLLAATEYLAEVHQSRVSEENSEGESISVQASRREVLARCLYGVDMDENALAVASGVLSCAFQCGEQEPVDFSSKLRQGNSLLGLPASQLFSLPHFAYEEQKRKRRAGNANKKCFEDKNTPLLRELKSVRSNIKVTKEKLNAGGASLQMTFLSGGDYETENMNRLSALISREKEIGLMLDEHLKQPPTESHPLAQILLEDEHSRQVFRLLGDAMLGCWWQKERKTRHDLTTDAVAPYLQHLLNELEISEGGLYNHLNERSITHKIPAHYVKIEQQTRALREEHRFFHWELEFSELFLKPTGDGGFDAILGNPPWGIKLSRIERRRFSWAFPQSGDNETAWAFLELAMQLVKPNEGRIGFIVPNTFLLNESSLALREHVAEQWTLEHLLDYSAVAVFEGASVRACQLHILKTPPNREHTYRFFRPNQSPPNEESTVLSQSSLQGRRHWGRPELTLRFDIERFTTIGDLCELRQGYKPYAKDKFIERGMTQKQAEKVVKTRPYHHKEPAEGRTLQRFGAEIHAFKVVDGDDLARWVELDQTAETVPEEWQTGPRIAVREIAGASPNLIIAAYTEDHYVHDPSIISLRAKDGNEWVYPLLELYLNSAFCEEHVLYYSAKAGKGLFAKFTLGDLKELPVPKLEIIGEERLQACSDVLGGVRSDSNNEVLRAEIEDLLCAIYS
jgi:hypothetical protein